MKKRTKISLRTKIYLTLVGLLALTGVFYAANPSPFVTSGHGVFQPIGMAADKTNGGHLYVSQYEDNDIQVVDCNGNGTLFGTLPGTVQPLVEKYMALAPAESAAAGFTPGDLFVTLREQIYVAHPPSGTFTQFADLSGVLGGCPFSDHSAITFDKVGGPNGFGFNMIVTCENGRVWQINNTGVVTHIADTTTVGHSQTLKDQLYCRQTSGPWAARSWWPTTSTLTSTQSITWATLITSLSPGPRD